MAGRRWNGWASVPGVLVHVFDDEGGYEKIEDEVGLDKSDD